MESKNKGLLAYILVCILWGSTYLAIKIGVHSFPPFLFGGIRYLIAGFLILLYGYIKKLEFPKDKKDYIRISIAGLLMLGLSNGLILIAEMRINSSTAALLVAIVPIFMAIIEQFIPGGSKISLFGWIGMVIGFAGVGILSLSGEGLDTDTVGIMLMIFASLAWAGGSICSKRTVAGGSIIIHISIQMLAGGLFQTFIGIVTGEMSRLHPEASGVWALIYLVIFGSLIGYTSYIYLISVWPISKAGTYAYINPIVAMILGWMILKEPVTLKMIISTIMVLAGVIIVQRSKVVEKAAKEAMEV